MNEIIVADLSKVQTNIVIGPDGKTRWSYPSRPERSALQNLCTRKFVESVLALEKAADEGANDLEQIAAYSEEKKVVLAKALLTNRKTLRHPTDVQAQAMVDSGFIAHLMAEDAKQSGDEAGTPEEEREAARENMREFDLAAFRRRMNGNPLPAPVPLKAVPAKKRGSSRR